MRLVCLAFLASGCAVKGVVPPPALSTTATVPLSLEVCVPRDVRPTPERRGQKAGTALWAFADVYTFTHHRGAVISRDAGLYPPEADRRAGSSHAAQALAESLVVSLERSGAFTSVTLGDTCEESPAAPSSGAVLWTRLENAYGSIFLVHKQWRYPIARFGDQVWMETVVEDSATPAFGYARATWSLCTTEACHHATVAGHSATELLRAPPGSSTRGRVNIELGRALSDLASRIGRGAIDEATGPQTRDDPQ